MEKMTILGAGISGVGAPILAKKKGFDVFVSDLGIIKDKYKTQLTQNGIPFEEGQHSKAKIMASKEVIKSPGIPDKAQIIIELREKGIPVVSEIEIASKYT